jgi:NhaA family Na+:H+ antiporter
LKYYSAAENVNEDKPVNTKHPRLPTEFVDWLTNPLTRFFRIEIASGFVLLLFTIAALVLANLPWGHHFLEA